MVHHRSSVRSLHHRHHDSHRHLFLLCISNVALSTISNVEDAMMLLIVTDFHHHVYHDHHIHPHHYVPHYVHHFFFSLDPTGNAEDALC